MAATLAALALSWGMVGGAAAENFRKDCTLSWQFFPKGPPGQTMPPVKIVAINHWDTDTLRKNSGGPGASGITGLVETRSGRDRGCSVSVLLSVENTAMVQLVHTWDYFQTLPQSLKNDQCMINRNGVWSDGWATGQCGRGGSDIIISLTP